MYPIFGKPPGSVKLWDQTVPRDVQEPDPSRSANRARSPNMQAYRLQTGIYRGYIGIMEKMMEATI